MPRHLDLPKPRNRQQFLRSCARLNDFLRAVADDLDEWADALDDIDGMPGSVTDPVYDIAHGVHKAADGVRVATMSLLAGTLVHDVGTALRGMPEPPTKPTPLADLQAAKATIDSATHNTPETNRGIGVPDHIARPILTLLAQRGPAGARRVELVNAVGMTTHTKLLYRIPEAMALLSMSRSVIFE